VNFWIYAISGFTNQRITTLNLSFPLRETKQKLLSCSRSFKWSRKFLTFHIPERVTDLFVKYHYLNVSLVTFICFRKTYTNIFSLVNIQYLRNLLKTRASHKNQFVDIISAKYNNIKFHRSNFKCLLLLPYKFPRPLDRKLPTPCLMYDVRFVKTSVHTRKYCHTIFRCDGVNTQLTSANAKLVLMRLQTNKEYKMRAIWSILFLITKIKFFH